MTDTTPTVEQTFQENIKARLREDIGKLMPDEVLSKMIEKATQEMFFTKREVKDSYGYSRGKEDSWFETEVAKQLRNRIETSLTAYFEKNEEELTKLVVEELVKRGPELIGQVLISALTGKANRLESSTMSLSEVLRQHFLQQHNGQAPTTY